MNQKKSTVAIQFIIRDKAGDILQRELRPEFIKEMRNLEKTAKFKTYKSMDDFWDVSPEIFAFLLSWIVALVPIHLNLPLV